MNKIRIRFAPSPTGFVHIGSLWTALMNYLISKSLGATYILRIEDTDQKRLVEGSVENLIEVLNWANIKFDESPNQDGKFGPYVQSQRLDIYKKYINEILEKEGAYYCFCSEERLKEMRIKQEVEKLPPRYDRHCRELTKDEIEKKISNGEKYVIRQKMPLIGEVVCYDELRGEIKFKAGDLDDQVLIKSDGMPTYHFASVVDDHIMKISHVTRGQEWIPSFPKNILLYRSFGWEHPKFIHFPVILDKEGGKLSKRKGNVAVEAYRAEGYLPEALINFCALMGWHPKNDNEILSIDEIIKIFDYKNIGISGAVFDIEKLDFFNGYYIRHKNIDELVDLCEPYLQENITKTKDSRKKDRIFLKKIVSLEQGRMKKLSEIGELTEFFFKDELVYDKNLLLWKKLNFDNVKKNLSEALQQLEKIPEKNWTNDSIQDALISYIQAVKGKNGDYLWPVRVALTGKQASPSPFDVAEVLGKDTTLKRIKQSIELL